MPAAVTPTAAQIAEGRDGTNSVFTREISGCAMVFWIVWTLVCSSCDTDIVLKMTLSEPWVRFLIL